MHPYINGLNFPGFGKAAVEKLIEIEERKGVRINGIVMDNLAIDSGESGRGSDGKNPFGDGWHTHRLGLARGWKLLENAAGTGQIANETGDCTLIAGDPPDVCERRTGTGDRRLPITHDDDDAAPTIRAQTL